jgi:hypothetical protein
MLCEDKLLVPLLESPDHPLHLIHGTPSHGAPFHGAIFLEARNAKDEGRHTCVRRASARNVKYGSEIKVRGGDEMRPLV